MVIPSRDARPARKPDNPRFSSGPCSKRPGWSPEILRGAALGRSHRSVAGRERLARAIELTRETLRVPTDYRIAIVPASDTGAVELALWSLLGARGVDVAAWESFSNDWLFDVLRALRLPDVRSHGFLEFQAACAAMALVVTRLSSWQMVSTSASENSPSGPIGARSLKGES